MRFNINGLIVALVIIFVTGCSEDSSPPPPSLEKMYGFWEQNRAIAPDGSSESATAEESKNSNGEFPFVQIEITSETIRVVTFFTSTVEENISAYQYVGNVIKRSEASDGGLRIVSVTDTELTVVPVDDDPSYPMVFRKIDKDGFDQNAIFFLGKPADSTIIPYLAPENLGPTLPKKMNLVSTDGVPNFGVHYSDVETNEPDVDPFVGFTLTVEGNDLGGGLPLESHYWAVYSNDLKTKITEWQNLNPNPSTFLIGHQAEVLSLNDPAEITAVLKEKFKNLVIAFSVNNDIGESKITHYIDLRELCENHPEAFSSKAGALGCD